MKIDSHVHFWELVKGHSIWISKKIGGLQTDFTPDMLKPLCEKKNVDGVILVQAAAAKIETDYMLNLANNDKFIKGVIGWVDLELDSLMLEKQILTLKNTNISGNYGGAISSFSSNLNFTNTVIARNTGNLFNAAGIQMNESYSNFSNLTITDNYGGWGPVSINLDELSSLNMTNSIAWNSLIEVNQHIGSSSGYNYNYDNINILYSNIEGGWIGEGNISQDPLFVNPSLGMDNQAYPSFMPAFGDYNLQISSPCIDVGTAFFELDSEILVDIDDSEYSGEAPDMGAFEYHEWNIGDINIDGVVNVLDIVVFVQTIVGE